MSMHPEINQIFTLLDNWRLLPAYQLERRVDIFFALYLEHIIQDLLGQKVLKIIPEFPIHKKTLDENKNDQSYKMDYLVICEEKVLFIELKTDVASINDKQLCYLKSAKSKGIENLINGVLKIYKKSKYKTKYQKLLEELTAIGWLKETNNKWDNISSKHSIEILYIQPSEGKISKDFSVISFETIAKSIEKLNTDLALRFAQSLRTW